VRIETGIPCSGGPGLTPPYGRLLAFLEALSDLDFLGLFRLPNGLQLFETLFRFRDKFAQSAFRARVLCITKDGP
jgi:hypothetical protein